MLDWAERSVVQNLLKVTCYVLEMKWRGSAPSPPGGLWMERLVLDSRCPAPRPLLSSAGQPCCHHYNIHRTNYLLNLPSTRERAAEWWPTILPTLMLGAPLPCLLWLVLCIVVELLAGGVAQESCLATHQPACQKAGGPPQLAGWLLLG